jgi:hypothetical protein
MSTLHKFDIFLGANIPCKPQQAQKQAFAQKQAQQLAQQAQQLAFVEQETLVQQIKKTPQAYQSKTFHLQFVEITEASGFSYQLLTELIMNH